MRFASLEYLYLLFLPFLVIIFFFYSSWKKKKLLIEFGREELLERVAISFEPRMRRLKRALIIIGIIFLLVSLSRPQWGAKISKMERKGIDLIIAVDLSISMLAQDIKPSRLDKAKLELGKLVGMLQGDRVGLVGFAGSAFNLCPLTLDYEAVKLFLDNLSPALMPVPGTAIGKAIDVAVESFEPGERKHKVLILLTDGEDHGSDPLTSADRAKEQGVVIYTIGIGSSEGAPIPIEAGQGELSYKRDRDGSLVMSKLDEETLKKISLKTGGKYYYVSPKEMELSLIYDEVLKMEKKKFEEEFHIEYEDRFQYFLAVAILCFALEPFIPERRRSK